MCARACPPNPQRRRTMALHTHVPFSDGLTTAGLGVAVVRAFPANAALFLGYELAREILD